MDVFDRGRIDTCLSVGLICLVLGGCARLDWDFVRRDQTASHQASLEALREAELAGRDALDLEACIEIALRNNLALRSAEIQSRVARLERKIAFANFLPAIELQYQDVSWDKQPKSQMLGPFSIPMHDQRMRDTVIQMQMPIFLPAAWYAYSMRTRGAEIGDIVEDYTRQMICLQVTAGYFHVLALEENESALRAQLAAAETLEAQVAAFREEGLVSTWQYEQSRLLVLSRRSALSENDRAAQQARAGLLTVMGLSPLGDLTLSPGTPLHAPDSTLDDLVLEALLNNPRLHIADRQVAIAEDQVRLAITEFLPKLFGFVSRTTTTNSFIAYPDYFMFGASGVMSLFEGFANINEYRAARERKEGAFLAREEAVLTLMTEVLRAHLQLESAQEDRVLADQALVTAASRLTEVEAQWAEGLIDASERLNATAERDVAQAHVTNARFQEQVAIAVLRNLLGESAKTDSIHEEPQWKVAP